MSSSFFVCPFFECFRVDGVTAVEFQENRQLGFNRADV